ncbi:hypothetical protein FHT44_002322 [Mycolicibacterium sp. BK634]|uniref:HNH endonuclease n=1 Tax=Mycolicibacterium sp. BK634 TaxID=2587099 RepID=UPI0016183758|nr:HNH endonuclease signature motif containing protein [Mycolicibacterium sp. BK634]MBB3749861.1 hypothetical protein [Mycolicibacterium sp. BK634]
MWAASLPNHSAGQVAAACVANAKATSQLKALVTQSLQYIEKNSETYREVAARDALHTTSADDFPLPVGLTREHLFDLYTNRLANRTKASAQAKIIYRALRDAGPDKRCAYCRSSPARQLDHFMPKDGFFTLAIEPWNLVPCCNTCNQALLARWNTIADQRMIHPYFMPPLGRWLAARIDVGDPANNIEPIVVYTAEPNPDMLEEELCNRVREQFRQMDLAATLSDAATTDLEDAKWSVRLSSPGSRDNARADLMHQARVRLNRDPNHPIGVLYEALANDNGFIDFYLTDNVEREILEPSDALR